MLAVNTGLPRVVRADASEKAAAEALFREAKALLQAGKPAEACPKFEASQRLDPTDGTLLNIALCYEAWGKTATAWALFNESISRAKKAGRADREQLAREHALALEPRLSRLTVTVAAPVAGLAVQLDGRPLDAGAWGSSLPIDPGQHTVTATASGYQPWRVTLELAAERDQKSVSIPVLTRLPEAPSTNSAGAPERPTQGGSASGPSLAPFISIGIGAIVIGGGVGAHLAARNARDDYFAGCAVERAFVCSDESGRSRVRSWETVQWVALGTGVAALGLGIALLATRPTRRDVAVRITPDVGVGGAGLTLSGAF
jgi:hypothetical protein